MGSGNLRREESHAVERRDFASGNVQQDALFTDAAGGDYTLTGGANVEVRQGGLDGAAEGWSFTADKDGVTRTNDTSAGPSNANAGGWSMGAYEKD